MDVAIIALLFVIVGVIGYLHFFSEDSTDQISLPSPNPEPIPLPVPPAVMQDLNYSINENNDWEGKHACNSYLIGTFKLSEGADSFCRSPKVTCFFIAHLSIGQVFSVSDGQRWRIYLKASEGSTAVQLGGCHSCSE